MFKAQMNSGIRVKILGDFEPFSKMGKSIGYQVTAGGASYLIDCGAPLFQQIGDEGIDRIGGVLITHCHDDHKRWFTDLALFKMYKPQLDKKIHLLATEDVLREIMVAAAPSLDRSLSQDSKRIVNIPFDAYVEATIIGPRARYRIVEAEEGYGRKRLMVADTAGSPVPPDKAKIVVHPKTKRARMLFKDPDYNEWVEPESFYAFSSPVFYEENKNIYQRDGITIEALKASVWHGIPAMGLRIRTRNETVVFSSDTVHDLTLWKTLSEEKREQMLQVSEKEFHEASVLSGDINDYIERCWSRERFQEALRIFEEGIVIHDVASRKSVVHTDYEKLHLTSLDRKRTILTHSPDSITSEWFLCNSEKEFDIQENTFSEVVNGVCHRMNAAVFHREGGLYFVGYKNEQGKYIVYRRNGLLGITSDKIPEGGEQLYRVDLYEDVGGSYFPKLEKDNAVYMMRRDGKIELVEFSADGSSGTVVQSSRESLKHFTREE